MSCITKIAHPMSRSEQLNLVEHTTTKRSMCKMTALLWVFLALVLTQASAAECPKVCNCRLRGINREAVCSARNLQTLPDDGSDIYGYLDLSYNRLRDDVHDDAFESFSSLVSLNLSFNFIQELNVNALRGLEHLEQLDLRNNSLTTLHADLLRPCEGVQWLSLESNAKLGRDISIKEKLINKDENATTPWLQAPSLRILNLRHCGITILPRWVLSGLPGLQSLDISHNQIKDLPVLTLASVCRLTSITLVSNNWYCKSCENLRAHRWMADQRIIETKNRSICSSFSPSQGCDTKPAEIERDVHSHCLQEVVPLPKPRISRSQATWLYVGFAAAVVIILVFLSLIANAVFSSLCRNSKHARTSSVHNDPPTLGGEQELLQVDTK